MIISGRDNPKIKHLAKLISSKKTRNESNEFVIEGVRGCIDAVAAFLDDKSIELTGFYYVKEAIEAYRGVLDVELFSRLPETLRFEITRSVAGRISDAETSQGIYAVAKCLHKQLSPESLDPEGKYLILDGLQDPGNVGTIIRTADAVGVDGVVLSGHCVDLYNPKAVRSTVGSLPRVNVFIEDDFCKVSGLFSEKNIRTVAAVVDGGTEIRDFDFSGGCAVVIGNEGRGIPQEHLPLCTDRVTIAMNGRIESMNAASACTVFLWEMTRGKN